MRLMPKFFEMDADEGMVQATEDDFNRFCGAVVGALDKFGMSGWRVSFAWLENSGEASACVEYDCRSMEATFIFGKRMAMYFKDGYMLDELAAHEVLHLLFAEFDFLRRQGNVSDDVWEAAEHRIINRIEGILFYAPSLRGNARFFDIRNSD